MAIGIKIYFTSTGRSSASFLISPTGQLLARKQKLLPFWIFSLASSKEDGEEGLELCNDSSADT